MKKGRLIAWILGCAFALVASGAAAAEPPAFEAWEANVVFLHGDGQSILLVDTVFTAARPGDTLFSFDLPVEPAQIHSMRLSDSLDIRQRVNTAWRPIAGQLLPALVFAFLASFLLGLAVVLFSDTPDVPDSGEMFCLLFLIGVIGWTVWQNIDREHEGLAADIVFSYVPSVKIGGVSRGTAGEGIVIGMVPATEESDTTTNVPKTTVHVRYEPEAVPRPTSVAVRFALAFPAAEASLPAALFSTLTGRRTFLFTGIAVDGERKEIQALPEDDLAERRRGNDFESVSVAVLPPPLPEKMRLPVLSPGLELLKQPAYFSGDLTVARPAALPQGRDTIVFAKAFVDLPLARDPLRNVPVETNEYQYWAWTGLMAWPIVCMLMAVTLARGLRVIDRISVGFVMIFSGLELAAHIGGILGLSEKRLLSPAGRDLLTLLMFISILYWTVVFLYATGLIARW